MNNKGSKKRRAVIMSDKYVKESGLQGGNVIANHLSLSSFIVGISFLLIGIIALLSIVFNTGFPTHAAGIIAALVVTVIGFLLVIGGYTIAKSKHKK